MKNLILLAVIPLIMLSSCKKEEDEVRIMDENYNPVIVPENFVDSVTNVYFPLTPGKVYSFEAQTADGLETIVVTVLSETKMVAGVKCTVVRDIVSLSGQVVEDTYDWYAQDKEGNVWYMGEDVSNYENGQLVDKDGSFEVGVDGAKAGIVMMAIPVLGLPYRQEYYFNNAEDWGKVVAKGLTVTCTYGTFTDCIKTEDWNALEPDLPKEFKYYAPGIGMIKEETENSSEVVNLVSVQ